jgi:hypothetical protein
MAEIQLRAKPADRRSLRPDKIASEPVQLPPTSFTHH